MNESNFKEAVVFFRYGPIHVPMGRRNWPHQYSVEVRLKGSSPRRRTLNIAILKPQRIHTHLLEESDPESKVGDAWIPIAVTCSLEPDEVFYRVIADVAAAKVAPAIEKVRAQTRQADLKLKGISDLRFHSVVTPNGQVIEDLTGSYGQWFEDQERDRPLPFISIDDWGTMGNALNSQSKQSADPGVPLYESLLLDAELQLDSEPRTAVLFAALACELAVQEWLKLKSRNDNKLEKWLDWSQGANVSIKGYYDFGVFLAVGTTLKSDANLWKELEALVKARNDVAHRGVSPKGHPPAVSIQTARRVISWLSKLTPV